MNNLHRELAPISDDAWAQLEEETTRTLKRLSRRTAGGRSQVPGGVGLSAVGTGHLKAIAAPGDGVLARQREVKPLVELRVPFDSTAFRSTMSSAARTIPTGNRRRTPRRRSPMPRTAPSSMATPPRRTGIRQGTSNPVMTLPADVRHYPDAIAQALSQFRLAGVNGPYSVVLGAEPTRRSPRPPITAIRCSTCEETRQGRDHLAPALEGAFVLTTRGGDFDLHIGQDVSIGYLGDTDSAVRLYLQETLTFLILTSEASVALGPPATKLTT